MAPVLVREAGSITLSAGFGISTTSAHKDEAWKAIQVMTGPEAEQYLAEAGRAFAARKEFQKYWYDVAAAGVVGAREALPAALRTDGSVTPRAVCSASRGPNLLIMRSA
jgi:ABC-type glycerol-3-phosphate transport system substrate-binding protein